MNIKSILTLFFLQFALTGIIKAQTQEKTEIVSDTTTSQPIVEAVPIEQDIIIGPQFWKPRNLDITNYQDGTPITYAETEADWKNACTRGEGCWCYIKNKNPNKRKQDTTGLSVYGKLYNWYALNTLSHGGIAPVGYHVPNKAEWLALIKFCGEEVAGMKLKSLDYWENIKTNSNALKFAAQPAGYREPDGKYNKNDKLNCGYWTSSKSEDEESAYLFIFDSYLPILMPKCQNKGYGYSIRCIKD